LHLVGRKQQTKPLTVLESSKKAGHDVRVSDWELTETVWGVGEALPKRGYGQPKVNEGHIFISVHQVR
jgi:hypothetical protein